MRDSCHETVLQGPEAQGPDGSRAGDAEGGGHAGFRRVSADYKTLPEAAPETGGVEPKPSPGPPARKGAALEVTLPAQARAEPDLTLAEHCELFEEQSGMRVSTATMSRAFERLGLPLKSPSPRPSPTRKSGSAGASG